MASLVTLVELRSLVKTPLGDLDLQTILDRVEAEVIALSGAHYAVGAKVTETHFGGYPSLWLKRKATSISKVTETQFTDEDVILVAADYKLYGPIGRLVRLPSGTVWGEQVVVEYVTQDDSPLRKDVIIELTRLAIERTAMNSESVSGEYSYSAPDWDARRNKLLRRLILGKV